MRTNWNWNSAVINIDYPVTLMEYRDQQLRPSLPLLIQTRWRLFSFALGWLVWSSLSIASAVSQKRKRCLVKGLLSSRGLWVHMTSGGCPNLMLAVNTSLSGHMIPISLNVQVQTTIIWTFCQCRCFDHSSYQIATQKGERKVYQIASSGVSRHSIGFKSSQFCQFWKALPDINFEISI